MICLKAWADTVYSNLKKYKMKKSKCLLGEVVATLLFLVVFFAIRLWICGYDFVHITSEALSTVMAAFVITVAIIIYLSGNERGFLSFSFDVLVFTIAGVFLWELKGIELYALWFSLAVFATFVLVSVVNTVKRVHLGSTNAGERKILLESHSVISYGLAIKVVIMGLGVVLMEKILLPMLAV